MKRERVPNESGWYWYRTKGVKEPMVALIQSYSFVLHVRLYGDSYFVPLSKVDVLWGDRISDSPPIEEEQVCDFCESIRDVRPCQNCGIDTCPVHRYPVDSRSLRFGSGVVASLCHSCKDAFYAREVALLDEFREGKGLL